MQTRDPLNSESDFLLSGSSTLLRPQTSFYFSQNFTGTQNCYCYDSEVPLSDDWNSRFLLFCSERATIFPKIFLIGARNLTRELWKFFSLYHVLWKLTSLSPTLLTRSGCTFSCLQVASFSPFLRISVWDIVFVPELFRICLFRLPEHGFLAHVICFLVIGTLVGIDSCVICPFY